MTHVLTSGPLCKLLIPFTWRLSFPTFCLFGFLSLMLQVLAQMPPLPWSPPSLGVLPMCCLCISFHNTLYNNVFAFFCLPICVLIKTLAGVGWARMVFYHFIPRPWCSVWLTDSICWTNEWMNKWMIWLANEIRWQSGEESWPSQRILSLCLPCFSALPSRLLRSQRYGHHATSGCIPVSCSSTPGNTLAKHSFSRLLSQPSLGRLLESVGGAKFPLCLPQPSVFTLLFA